MTGNDNRFPVMLRVPPELVEQLDRMAHQQRTDRTHLIQRILQERVDKDDIGMIMHHVEIELDRLKSKLMADFRKSPRIKKLVAHLRKARK